ncbi:hypothetical protein [Romboutsia lituseburensis]|uniref:GOLD domain-containing protein n=1 Tax=Romboutsia lituseburensis DSM 797 TaxID=1121325 RepID=A0A1G9PK40_9FIRM|nr:hypothetical protein [Romboutsia lituseburensis]CEH33426.1 Prokaryotic membrane lipoprotein lipid attachment site profile [Romboutsia lituseburensis]SDL99206.1 hypothetical protein SAMN04515677_104403 [Romboutsia lituseburensis DSM 797]
MKKYLVIFLMTICTIFMLGCDMQLMYVTESDDDYWYSEYKLFNGSDSKTINVDKDQVVKFDVVSEKGNLNLSIKDENGETCFNKNNIETSSFEFTPKKNGKYEISVDAKKHKGGFYVLWGQDDSN